MLLSSDVLYMSVRYASPSGPMCLRCLMLTLSSLVELLFLLCFITTLEDNTRLIHKKKHNPTTTQ